MSVQNPYNDRLEIRVDKPLKDSIKSFCSKKGITPSFYLRQLAQRNLKKNGWLKESQRIIVNWKDVDDMPAEPETEKETWIRTA